ncbi:alpha/beta hydrolase [Pseudooceanicola sp. LIPI14-2-Ac024]|uniref:alpha/beta hydrolase n=1 Tax=Pseudooceanicola sp. LIPI14-2-Ac024 TaxID=3344875 RepID=UPI0035D137B3
MKAQPPFEFLLRALTALVLGTLLSACTPRPGIESLSPVPPETPTANVVRVYVATNRDADQRFGKTASFQTTYQFFDVSVPPGHIETALTFAQGTPDPETDFFVTQSGIIDRDRFLREVRRESQGGELAVFVHGFNTRHSEAVFRLAQLANNSGLKGAPVLFSWPSNGSPLDYVGDRQAALFSRDTLEALMTDLTADRPAMLIGHSMGGFITVEMLRSLDLKGDRRTMDRMQTILAAPDVDLLNFERIMRRIGPMRNPVVVLSSRGDRALQLSERISGGRVRLGSLNINDPRMQEVARLGNVELIDISAVGADDSFGHHRFVQLASYYSRAQANVSGQSGLGGGAGVYVINSLDNVIFTPILQRVQ